MQYQFQICCEKEMKYLSTQNSAWRVLTIMFTWMLHTKWSMSQKSMRFAFIS